MQEKIFNDALRSGSIFLRLPTSEDDGWYCPNRTLFEDGVVYDVVVAQQVSDCCYALAVWSGSNVDSECTCVMCVQVAHACDKACKLICCNALHGQCYCLLMA